MAHAIALELLSLSRDGDLSPRVYQADDSLVSASSSHSPRSASSPSSADSQ